jgi:hypothetical protein
MPQPSVLIRVQSPGTGRAPLRPSDLKKSNPSAGWQCQNGPRRGQFWSQMSTWTLGNRVRATCASSELCGLTSLTRTMQKNRVLSPKNAPKNSRSHLSNDLSFCTHLVFDGQVGSQRKSIAACIVECLRLSPGQRQSQTPISAGRTCVAQRVRRS